MERNNIMQALINLFETVTTTNETTTKKTQKQLTLKKAQFGNVANYDAYILAVEKFTLALEGYGVQVDGAEFTKRGLRDLLANVFAPLKEDGLYNNVLHCDVEASSYMINFILEHATTLKGEYVRLKGTNGIRRIIEFVLFFEIQGFELPAFSFTDSQVAGFEKRKNQRAIKAEKEAQALKVKAAKLAIKQANSNPSGNIDLSLELPAIDDLLV